VALSEKHRSTLYQGLVDLIPDEQAVEEMLSYFPARDVEEPVTKDYLRAEMAELRTELRGEMAELRTELRGEMALLRTDIHREMAELRAELRGEMAELRTELRTEMERMMRTMQAWMIGTAVSVGGLVVGAAALT
jgi:hypothetical protein